MAMNETPWTPGPWEWWDDGSLLANADELGLVLQLDELPADADYLIAPADARLIAAAPTMAELLAEILAESDTREWHEGGPIPATEEIRALLSRIRGETP